MKLIINFFKKLFKKSKPPIENIDIAIKLWNPPKNVEIYKEIKEDHERNFKEEKPKRKKPEKKEAVKKEILPIKKPTKGKKTE